jgi:hypothetical protein
MLFCAFGMGVLGAALFYFRFSGSATAVASTTVSSK